MPRLGVPPSTDSADTPVLACLAKRNSDATLLAQRSPYAIRVLHDYEAYTTTTVYKTATVYETTTMANRSPCRGRRIPSETIDLTTLSRVSFSSLLTPKKGR